MWLRGVQFVQEEPASAPSTSPSEPRELRQVAACTAGSMVCGWRADARPTARAARATARPVVRAVRACARPMARAARAVRPVATGEGSASVGAPCGEGSAILNLRYLVTSMSPSHSSVQIRASGAPVRFRAPEERLTTNPTFWPDNSTVERGGRWPTQYVAAGTRTGRYVTGGDADAA